jgi:uncharacterized protein (TIGR01777 family)
MKIIIVGGTGLIGRALAKELTGRGHGVWILTRRPSTNESLDGASLVHWDGITPDGWGQLVNEADAIINLAGENIGASRWTEERKLRIVDSRLNAGRAVVTAIQRAARKPAVIVQASAIGYYGSSGIAEKTEQSPAGTDFLGRVCTQWEASTLAVEEAGVRRVVIRTGLVLSAQEGFLKQLLLPYRFFIGGKYGSGKQYWSWIHLRDEVNAIRFLVENGTTHGAFNLTSPNPVSMETFGRKLASVLHRPFWLPVPGLALRLLLGEMSQLVLTGHAVVPEALLGSGYRFLFPELRPALSDVLTHHPEKQGKI